MSRQPIVVYKGRTTIVGVSLGFDVSADTIVSEIREEKDQDADLIATWTVSFATDGKDGELILKINDESNSLVKSVGYMDMKRISSGEELPVFAEPIEVSFQSTITA